MITSNLLRFEQKRADVLFNYNISEEYMNRITGCLDPKGKSITLLSEMSVKKDYFSFSSLIPLYQFH